MNNIIICEDNLMQRNMVTSIIESESKNFNCKIELSTDDPHAVIKHIHSRENSFIYFLDINLNSDINGFDLAKLIRTYDPNGYIVFLTAHAELTLLTFEYKVQALDYIIKGDSEVIKPRIIECLNVIQNNIDCAKKNNNNKLSIDTGSNIILLDYDDILFFETSAKEHKISAHTINGQYEFYGTLKKLEKSAPSDFYKSHRSYLVNTGKIKSIDKNKMLINMINNEICYVSLRYMKGLLKKCI
ncbi:MAG: LytR/AlgR family response regulator transcription factor [Clostridium sp.]